MGVRHFSALMFGFMLSCLPSVSHAQDAPAIQQSIDRGVKCLRQLQQADGNWPYQRVGATALAGLALLECGVPSNDPAIQKAAAAVRTTCIDLDDTYTTYSLALSVLFLDRLGDLVDEPLIQALGVRLLAGQNPVGGWTYGCPRLGDEEERRLKRLVGERRELVAADKPPPAALPRSLQLMLARIEQQGPMPQAGLDNLLGGAGDNSNTQFAILGLWAAQRHGIPVARALLLTDARFRKSQRADGGWAYMPAVSDLPQYGVSTPAMTCAGLLGLAMGYGVAVLRTQPQPAVVQRDLRLDLAIGRGLVALASTLGQPLGRDPDAVRDYYFLWSLERVGVAYDVKLIGNTDWYVWASDIVVAVQRPDGSWEGKYGPDVDTSFALLFLRRANLARELTAYFHERMRPVLRAREKPAAK
jgi:hypothetical protein